MIVCALDERPRAGAVTAFGAWLARSMRMPVRVHARSPGRTLLAALERPDVRLLVLAAEGPGVEPTAPDLATIADSPRPVVAIPPRAAELWLAPHAASRNLRRVVVCGVDGSSDSLRAADEAGAVAARLGGPLLVAHAREDPPGGPPMWSRPGAADALVEAERSRRERVLKPTLEVAAARGAAAQARYLTGEPADALDGLAAEEAAALIAVGCHGLGRDRLALSGSVTRALTRGAGRPVLVIPPLARAEARGERGDAHARPAAGVGAAG